MPGTKEKKGVWNFRSIKVIPVVVGVLGRGTVGAHQKNWRNT